MPTPAEQFLSSFVLRATQALATLARTLAGALAAGDAEAAARLTYHGELLRQGLRSVTTPTNGLLEAQRLYVAEKLLGLLPAALVAPQAPAGTLTLSLDALPARVRGQAEATPLTLSGKLTGAVPGGAQLIFSRDGREFARQSARAGAYTLVDTTPGLRYQVELSGAGLTQQRTRGLVSPLLAGTGPAGADAAYVRSLPLAPALAAGVLRVTLSGQRSRILLAVPLSVGTVTSLTQPDDQDADLTMAFARRALTLDFGADGQDQYEVLENYSDFTGVFTLDAHLTLSAAQAAGMLDQDAARAASLPAAAGAGAAPVVIVPGASGAATAIVYTFHNQAIVTLVHGLDRYALVDVYDQDGQGIEGDVSYVNVNTVRVNFSQPLSGTVVVR